MRFSDTRVLQSINLEMNSGEFIAIGGPNGAGKSTLLSILAGLLTPTHGSCRFRGVEVSKWSRLQLTRQVAVVMQSEPLAFPFTAGDVVAMGRTPHLAGFFETAKDRALVRQALINTETSHLESRDFRTLSGGEKQRVLLASALAQSPQVLLLDEPATHLDIQHQVALHELLHKLSQSGLLVVAITHDLNLAAAYCDRLIILSEGRIVADDQPVAVLEPDLIRGVFKVEAEIRHTAAGRPSLAFGPLGNRMDVQ